MTPATQKTRKRSRSPVTMPLLPHVSTLSFGKSQKDPDVTTYSIMNGSEALAFTIGGAISPFELSSLMENAPRKTLTLKLPKIWEDAIDVWESELMVYMKAARATYFGQEVTEDEVATLYKSFTKKVGEYPRQLNLKVNTTGFHSVRYWDTEKRSMTPPTTHSLSQFNARCSVRSLWISKDGWGCVVDGHDLQLIQQIPEECPF